MASSLRASFAVVACAAVLLAARPAAAQDRLFVPPFSLAGVEIGAMSRFGDVLGPERGLARPLAGGGRFAVIDGSVVDLRTGASRALPLGATAAAVDPARPRLFLVTPRASTPAVEALGVFDVITGAVTPVVDLPACDTAFGLRRPVVRYASGAERLFAERCAALPGGTGDVLSFDLTTSPPSPGATLVGSLPVGAALLPSPDGTRVFVGLSSVFGGAPVLAAWDTTSAALVASTATSVGTLAWDDVRDWLLAANAPGPGAAGVVSAWTRDLGPIGAATFPAVGPCPVRLAVSAHTGRIYVTTGGSDYYGAPEFTVSAFGGTPPGLVGQAGLGAVARSCVGAVVRSAPGAPRNLRAAVSGQGVALSWDNIGGASSFVLDVGLGPGRTDLSIPLGVEPRVQFSGVPPGTYYLRVRGGNEFGGGRPSTERRLIVP